MKAVVGVGYMDKCLTGALVFAKLKFPSAEAVLVHTVEPILPDGGMMPLDSTGPIADIQRQRMEDGAKRMSGIAAQLNELGVPSRTVTTFGNPAHEITALAESENADLIVAGSQKKGKLETFIIGSVARALVVEAKRSILVGKQPLGEGTKINAVLATDHSEYANSCIDLLVRLAPQGLGKVTVVSADTTDKETADAMRQENAEGLGLEQVLGRRNEAIGTKLKPFVQSVDSVVLNGRANDVINAAMEETRAELLILGAHGHGFVERLLMGSTAMHMVGNSPWNVLVLRV